MILEKTMLFAMVTFSMSAITLARPLRWFSSIPNLGPGGYANWKQDVESTELL